MSQISTKVAKSDSVVETGCVPNWANRAYLGSCERMAEIPDASVHFCVTSPPYLGLRDYNAPGQIGLEPTIADYINRLVNVFREVRRVLRADGTAWVNIGDSYAGSWGNQSRSADRGTQRPINGEMLQPVHDGRYASASHTGVIRDPGLKPKDLRGIPWRLAFALQDDGWWLRDAIIWAKPNPMPSSVTDRCTPSYETIFMLSKSARYYADMSAVRQPNGESMMDKARHGAYKYKAAPYKHDEARKTSQISANRVLSDASALARIADNGANLRNVWTVATTTYSDAHFATFPIEIPSRCIRIGCPPGGIVLDPFLGSGTTAEAAEVLGRQWVGYEINPDYHALITARTRQMGLL